MKTQRRNSTSMNEATEGRREYPPMMRDLINHDVIPSVRESVSCIDLHNLLIEGLNGNTFFDYDTNEYSLNILSSI